MKQANGRVSRPWVKVALGVVVVLVLLAVILPLLVNANTFRPMLESQLSDVLNRPVKLGSLHFSPFSGSLKADSVTIGDDPKFSTQPFLSAGTLHIGVEMGPLIFHRILHVTKFSADQPQIHLVHNADGKWNYSSLGQSSASRTPQAPKPNPQGQTEPVMPGLTVGALDINDGKATVEDLPPTGKPRVYSNVNVHVTQFSFAKQFPFSVTATLPGDGTLDVRGQAGPVNEADAADTPLTADLNMKHFDPVAAGIVENNEGFSMLGDITAHVTSDGKQLATNGNVRTERLQLVRNGAPVTKPVDLSFRMVNNLTAQTGELQDVVLKTGNVAAHGNGTFKLTPQATMLNARLVGQNLPIDQLEALLPAAGVRLPNGSVLQGGVLSTNLTITGPANAPVITGPVDVENTRLAGFDLGSKLGSLAPLAGIQPGSATVVQTFRTQLNAANGGVQANNIYALVPILGTATGAGTVSPEGALNFHLLVKLSRAGVSGTAVGALSAVNGILGRAGNVATTSGIPLVITGTTTDPRFSADVRSLGSGLLSNGENRAAPQNRLQNVNPGQVLGNLLGSRRPH